MAWLFSLNGALTGRRFSLDAPCLVGRSPYNHVVLDDSRISRQHAKIAPESGGHVVYDLNSSNGTYVNDVQVTRQRLTPNDVVRFGPYSFKFERDGESDHAIVPRSRKRIEERTRRGFEPPAKIVDSLDASVIVPALTGLSELEDAERKLRTLYGFMQSISNSLDVVDVVDRIARNLIDIFAGAEMAAVYLVDSTGKMLPVKVVRRDGRPMDSDELSDQFHDEVVRKGRAVLSMPMSLSSDEQLAPKSGLAMHAPIVFGEVPQGVLHVRGVQRSGAPFSQNDLDLLAGIAAQAALALQNARLHEESLRQQRFQHDLALAEQIQRSFLPAQLPDAPGIEFFTEYRPAYQVGGDFYDVFRLSPTKIGIFVGDVSGKGVAAALLMARVSSDLRAAALGEPDPARALALVNEAMIDRRQHDTFVTVVYLTLDVVTRRVVVANAGHPPPLVRRGDGYVQRIEAGTGTAIGIVAEAVYEQTELTLDPGDVLVLCTDGVLEATDAQGRQLGLERVEQTIGLAGVRVSEVSVSVLEAVRRHAEGVAQYDDVTLLVLGFRPHTHEFSDMQTVRPDAPYGTRPFMRTDHGEH